jgi:predicted HicB family RNase H-like nuclease
VQVQQEGEEMKKIRSVRVSDQLWAKAKAKARAEGKSVSEVIVDFLKEFVK